nr:reverse transcriptase domain-containing protein [Tanacetum cinerariifolium]
MPSNVKTYDETDDPKDHLKNFQLDAKFERWEMPTWCHMFNSTLTGSARVWFDDLPPESIESYDDLKKSFLANCLQQKKCIKDPVEIHHIKQKEGESTKDFVQRMGDFKNQQRSEQKRDKFTLLTKSPREILALDKGKFKTPPSMTTPVEKRNNNKFCEFHREVGHNTDECMHLKRQIKELIKVGKLSHVIKELKQISGKNQPKEAKKGEASGKDKPLEILMVQPWQRVVRQRITQKEKIKVAIHPEYLEQTIAIGSTLTEEGLKALCELLRRNLEIFAWKPKDMTGVPRHLAKHRLNVRKDGYGARLILPNSEGAEFTYALGFSFKKFSIKQVPRSENKKADALSKLASTNFTHMTKQVLVEELKEKTLKEEEVLAVVEEEASTWMNPIYEYLTKETLPEEKEKGKGHMAQVRTSSNGDTPFSFTYGMEAIIPAEIGMPTLRTAKIDMVQNDEALEINLDLLEERREQATIHEARNKARWKSNTTQRSAVQASNKDTLCIETMMLATQRIVESLALNGKDHTK